MSDVNNIAISGRLTADPTGYSNDSVARLNIASNRSYRRNGSDAYEEETVFVEVSTFSGLATKCLAKLKKASYVTVQGRLELNKWKAEDGSNRSQLRVIATEVASEDFFVKAEPEAPKPRARRK